MDLGLFQRDVAAMISVHLQTLGFWELGLVLPELRYLPKILAFLGYDQRATPKTIAERLVAFRAGLGWNHVRLAEELKVDPATLSRWETGKKKPWGIYAERIEALLLMPAHCNCEHRIAGNGISDHSIHARGSREKGRA